MGKQIDERVVEMRFENGQFESNVKQSMSTIERLKSALKFNDQSKGLENVAAATKKVDMNQLAGSVDKVKVSFSALQVVAATALSRITNSAITAGKSLVSALTLDPVISGFQEYETKMNAVQTIMANVSSKGKTIADVNAVLDELNHYADKTIYNFTEMTRNIGTFTAAGVDLNVAATAIQGISNLAATAGSNAQQTSTAMYQLSQAIAAGAVKLQDWNSVVNAGMGGEIFQEGLKQTAREMGIQVDAMVKKAGSFRESLKEGWITTDVLNTTLKKFTVEGAEQYCKQMEASGKYTKEMSAKVMEQARTMEDAATKIKTFTQLWDTLKESAQSGWTESWEIIIGDFEQAKETLSKLGDMLTGFVQKAADRRNAILRDAMGGGTDAWKEIGSIVEDAGIKMDDFQKKMIEVGKKHGVVTDQMIKDAGGFTESLKSGWASADIVKETINSYIESGSRVTESTEDMTKKLETFQKVVDEVWSGKWSTAPERYQLLAKAGYDYAKVQELVNKTVDGHRLTLADLSETQAKALGFTDEQIATLKELSAQADATGSDLNTLIQKMSRPMSGRELLWGGLTNIIEAVAKALGALRDAWDEVFSIDTAGIIYKLLEGFYSFSEAIKLSDTSAENLKKTFKGLFSILKLVTTVITGALKGAFTILGKLFSSAHIDILKYTGYIGDLISRFTSFITSANGVTTVTNALRNAFTFVIEKAQQLWQWFSNLEIVQKLVAKATEFINEKIEVLKMLFGDTWKLFEGFYERIKAMDFSDGFHLSDIVDIFKDFKENVAGEIFDINGVIGGIKANFQVLPSQIVSDATAIGSGLRKVIDVLQNFATKLQLNIRPNINLGEILAIGLGASSMYYITQMGKLLEKLKGPTEALEALLNNVAGVPKAISGYINQMTKNVKADYVYTLAKAIGVLAASFVAIAAIPRDRILSSLAVIGVLAAVLGALAAVMSKLGIGTGAAGIAGAAGLGAMAAALISLGAGLALVSKALKTISDVAAGGNLTQSVAALELLMVTFTLMGKIMTIGGGRTSMAGAIKSIGSMLAFALVIKSLANALKSVSDIDGNKLITSMISLSGVMVAMRVVMGTMKGMSASAGIGAIAGIIALQMMLSAMKKLSQEPLDEILASFPALMAIVVAMSLLMASTRLAGRNAIRGGIGVAAMSGSIMLIANAMKSLAEIDEGSMERAKKAIEEMMVLMSLMMASTALSGKYSIRGGIAIVAMAASMTLLAGAIAVMSELDPAGVKTSTEAILSLGVMFTALLAVSGKATGAKATIIAITTSIAILAAAIAALSMIDERAVTRSTIAIESIMGMFTLMLAVMGKLKVAPTGFAGLVAALVSVGILVHMLNSIDAENALPKAKAISALMMSISVIMLSMQAFRGAKWKSLAIAGTALAGVTAAIYAIGSIIRALQDVQGLSDQALKSIGMFTGVLAALSGVVAAMSVLTRFVGIKNVMLGEAATAGIVAIMGVITGVISGITAIFDHFNVDLVSKLERGAEVMGKIGSAFGKLIGGIAGGVREEYSSHLPAVGTAMSEFAQNIQPFLNINDKIQNADLSNMAKVIESVGDMYKMEFFKGLGKKFNLGDMSLAGIGADLSAFGVGVAGMVEKTENLDVGAMTRMSKIVEALGTLMQALTPVGGWYEKIMGTTDLATFGATLQPFAEGLGNAIHAFRKNLISETDVANIQKVCEVTTALSGLTEGIDEIGGLMDVLAGTNDLGTFGMTLNSFATSLGNSIHTFRTNPISDTDIENVQKVCQITESLSGLTEGIDRIGGMISGLIGSNDLASFGSTLSGFAIGIGNALRIFKIIQPTDADITNTDTIVQVCEKLSNLQGSLERIGGVVTWFTGKKDLGTFGKNFSEFATAMMEGLQAFGAIQYTGMSNVGAIIDTGMIDNIVSTVSKFAELADTVPGEQTKISKFITGDKSLTGFAKEIGKFADEILPALTALGALSDATSPTTPKTIDTTFIDNLVQVVGKLAGLQQAIQPMQTWIDKLNTGHTTDISTFGEKIKSFAESFMPALQALGAISYTGMGNVSTMIDSSVIDAVVSAVKKLAELQTVINPMEGVIAQQMTGSTDLNNFADRITAIGEAMGAFNTAIGTDFNADGIDRAIESMRKIAELQNVINPMEGVINQQKTGTTDLSSFASRIEDLGKAMGKFSTSLGENFDVTAIDQAIASMKKITELQTALGGASEGGAMSTSLGQFATNLGQLGTQMKNMTTNFSGIDWSSVDTAIQQINKLSDLASQLASADFSGFATFSNQLGELATNSIQKFVQGFQNAGSQASAAVANFINQIKSTLTNNASGVAEAGGNLVKDIPSKIKSHASEMNSAGSELAKAVKTGIDSGKQGIETAFNSSIQACITAVRGARAGFQSAGQYAAEGMAAGIRAATPAAVAAAHALSAAVTDAARVTLDVNSPSKVFMKIGGFVVAGLTNGIRLNTPQAEKQSMKTAQSIVEAFQKELDINSPSKVTRDEVGRYIVDGIAEGIEKNTSAEEAAEKKAQNIVNAFKTEIDKFELDETSWDLEKKLWEAMNPEATEDEKTAKAIELNQKKLQTQASKVLLAQGEYETIVKELGKDTEEAQEAYNKYLQETTELYELANEIVKAQSTSQKKTVETQREAYIKAQEFMNQESIKTMLSLGYTMEELWDYAFEKFGYDKNMGFIQQQANTTLSESQQMVNAALANAKGTYAEFTGTAKAAGTVAGNAYVAANASAIQNGSKTTAAAATKNTTNVIAATAATTAADGKKVGAAYADAMAAGIESRQARVIETIKKLLVLSAEDIKDAAEETIHKFIQAVGEIADKTDELTDYEPVIRPVVDMSDVEKKAQIINSTFNGGGRSYNVASRTQRAVTSSNNTTQSNSMKATPGGNVYQVTQNNYSPKALDRSEIYRQTKNLYSQIAKAAPQVVSSIYKKSNG